MAKSRAKFLELIDEIVGNFSKLPDDAIIPTQAVARLRSISNKTVRRSYPMVRVSPGRVGVRVGVARAIPCEAKAPPSDATA